MAKRATDPGNPSRRVGDDDEVRGNPDWSPWVLLLIIPVVVPLIPALYNFREPELFDIPAFYWLQLAFVFLSAGLTALVYVKTRKR